MNDFPEINTVSQAVSAAIDELFTNMKAAMLMAEEILRLQAIVDKLPKDANGVPVVPCVDQMYLHDWVMRYWIWHPAIESWKEWRPGSPGRWSVEARTKGGRLIYDTVPSGCYSTAEAAKAAENAHQTALKDRAQLYGKDADGAAG